MRDLPFLRTAAGSSGRPAAGAFGTRKRGSRRAIGAGAPRSSWFGRNSIAFSPTASSSSPAPRNSPPRFRTISGVWRLPGLEELPPIRFAGFGGAQLGHGVEVVGVDEVEAADHLGALGDGLGQHRGRRRGGAGPTGAPVGALAVVGLGPVPGAVQEVLSTRLPRRDPGANAGRAHRAGAVRAGARPGRGRAAGDLGMLSTGPKTGSSPAMPEPRRARSTCGSPPPSTRSPSTCASTGPDTALSFLATPTDVFAAPGRGGRALTAAYRAGGRGGA